MKQEIKSIKNNLNTSYDKILEEYQQSSEKAQKLQGENKKLKEELSSKSSELMVLKAQIIEQATGSQSQQNILEQKLQRVSQQLKDQMKKFEEETEALK